MNKLTLTLFVLFLIQGKALLEAQELPRPSMARHETVATLPSDYNLKLGPVLFNVNASMEAEYVDNIALSDNHTKSDVILTPQVGVTAAWPISATNTLSFSTSLGYSKYLIHPQYDQGQLLVAPDSNLSFDIYVGDFKINLHDQFSYQQDPASIGSLSNVVTFSRFQNVAGIGVIWDLNKLVLTLNYDHITFISDNLQFANGSDYSNADNLSYSAEQVSASATYAFTSTVSAGVEASASIRDYDHFGIEDTSLSAGPFIRVQVTPNFNVSASAGFQITSSDSGSLNDSTINRTNYIAPSLGTGSDDGYYANITFDHRWNAYFTDRLSLGHETSIDVFSQVDESTYASYTSSWRVNSKLNIATTLNFQDVDSPSGGGIISTPSYDLFTAGVQANFPVTKSISGAVLYQFNDKFDTAYNEGFTQNRVGLILNYHF